MKQLTPIFQRQKRSTLLKKRRDVFVVMCLFRQLKAKDNLQNIRYCLF